MRHLIGIPSYRGGERLNCLLTSLTHLDHRDFSVVVVDDGSPIKDFLATAQVVERFGWVSIHHPATLGLPGAYNTILRYGIDHESVCLLDDDTLLPSNFLRCLDYIHAHDQLAVAGFISERFTPAQMVEHKNNVPILGDDRPPEFATELAGQCFCINKTVRGVEDLRFDTNYRYYIQDSSFCCLAASRGVPSFRFHYPRIPHLEHGTLGEYPELRASESVSKDLEVFRWKWCKSPPEQEAEFAVKLKFDSLLWTGPKGELVSRPSYKGKKL